jgi:hypothetical protein
MMPNNGAGAAWQVLACSGPPQPCPFLVRVSASWAPAPLPPGAPPPPPPAWLGAGGGAARRAQLLLTLADGARPAIVAAAAAGRGGDAVANADFASAKSLKVQLSR